MKRNQNLQVMDKMQEENVSITITLHFLHNNLVASE